MVAIVNAVMVVAVVFEVSCCLRVIVHLFVCLFIFFPGLFEFVSYFSTKCYSSHLENNTITEVESGTFNNLVQLEEMFVHFLYFVAVDYIIVRQRDVEEMWQ